jgi:hypothetical protein
MEVSGNDIKGPIVKNERLNNTQSMKIQIEKQFYGTQT